MSDPKLDLSRPWFVADLDAPPAEEREWDWSGWTELGTTDDTR